MNTPRKSSILKQSRASDTRRMSVTQEDQKMISYNTGRRVSFSGKKNIKIFHSGAEEQTIWHNSYEISDHESCDNLAVQSSNKIQESMLSEQNSYVSCTHNASRENNNKKMKLDPRLQVLRKHKPLVDMCSHINKDLGSRNILKIYDENIMPSFNSSSEIINPNSKECPIVPLERGNIHFEPQIDAADEITGVHFLDGPSTINIVNNSENTINAQILDGKTIHFNALDSGADLELTQCVGDVIDNVDDLSYMTLLNRAPTPSANARISQNQSKCIQKSKDLPGLYLCDNPQASKVDITVNRKFSQKMQTIHLDPEAGLAVTCANIEDIRNLQKFPHHTYILPVDANEPNNTQKTSLIHSTTNEGTVLCSSNNSTLPTTNIEPLCNKEHAKKRQTIHFDINDPAADLDITTCVDLDNIRDHETHLPFPSVHSVPNEFKNSSDSQKTLSKIGGVTSSYSSVKHPISQTGKVTDSCSSDNHLIIQTFHKEKCAKKRQTIHFEINDSAADLDITTCVDLDNIGDHETHLPFPSTHSLPNEFQNSSNSTQKSPSKIGGVRSSYSSVKHAILQTGKVTDLCSSDNRLIIETSHKEKCAKKRQTIHFDINDSAADLDITTCVDLDNIKDHETHFPFPSTVANEFENGLNSSAKLPSSQTNVVNEWSTQQNYVRKRQTIDFDVDDPNADLDITKCVNMNHLINDNMKPHASNEINLKENDENYITHESDSVGIGAPINLAENVLNKENIVTTSTKNKAAEGKFCNTLQKRRALQLFGDDVLSMQRPGHSNSKTRKMLPNDSIGSVHNKNDTIVQNITCHEKCDNESLGEMEKTEALCNIRPMIPIHFESAYNSFKDVSHINLHKGSENNMSNISNPCQNSQKTANVRIFTPTTSLSTNSALLKLSNSKKRLMNNVENTFGVSRVRPQTLSMTNHLLNNVLPGNATINVTDNIVGIIPSPCIAGELITEDKQSNSTNSLIPKIIQKPHPVKLDDPYINTELMKNRMQPSQFEIFCDSDLIHEQSQEHKSNILVSFNNPGLQSLTSYPPNDGQRFDINLTDLGSSVSCVKPKYLAQKLDKNPALLVENSSNLATNQTGLVTHTQSNAMDSAEDKFPLTNISTNTESSNPPRVMLDSVFVPNASCYDNVAEIEPPQDFYGDMISEEHDHDMTNNMNISISITNIQKTDINFVVYPDSGMCSGIYRDASHCLGLEKSLQSSDFDNEDFEQLIDRCNKTFQKLLQIPSDCRPTENREMQNRIDELNDILRDLEEEEMKLVGACYPEIPSMIELVRNKFKGLGVIAEQITNKEWKINVFNIAEFIFYFIGDSLGDNSNVVVSHTEVKCSLEDHFSKYYGILKEAFWRLLILRDLSNSIKTHEDIFDRMVLIVDSIKQLKELASKIHYLIVNHEYIVKNNRLSKVIRLRSIGIIYRLEVDITGKKIVSFSKDDMKIECIHQEVNEDEAVNICKNNAEQEVEFLRKFLDLDSKVKYFNLS